MHRGGEGGERLTREERQVKIDWLKQHLKAQQHIHRIEKNLLFWQDKKTKITKDPTYFTSVDDEKTLEKMDPYELRLNNLPPVTVRGSGGKGSVAENAIAKIDEIERERVYWIKAYTKTWQEIEAAVEALESEEEREVLWYKYIEGMYHRVMCHQEVARVTHQSKATARRIHDRALKNIKMSTYEHP